MTYKNKALPFVFAFAALMLAWPMTAQTAFADGDATITAECGITAPSDIDLGAIAIGADSTEELTAIVTTGTVTGTLELQATDWTGVGTSATGSITLVNVADLEEIQVNLVDYVAEDDGEALTGNEFATDGTDIAAATSLAAVINSVDGGAVTASHVTDTNTVLISFDTLGLSGNAITLTESVTDSGTIVFPTDGTLDGAETTGVVHMQSEATHFVLTTDGSTNAAVAYSTKAPIGLGTITTVLTSNTSPNNNINLYLQNSGVSTLELLPYSGALESTFAFGTTCN